MRSLRKLLPLATVVLLATPAQARVHPTRAHKGAKTAAKAPKISEKDQKTIDAVKKVTVADFDWRTDALPEASGYFLSTVDSVLKIDPRGLDAHVATAADGSLKVDDQVRVDVFFWEKQPTGKFTKTWVKVDARSLAPADAKASLLQGFSAKPMLPVLLRGYTQLREAQGFRPAKGPARAADDGYTAALAEALLGRPAQKPLLIKATPTFADEVFNTVAQSVAQGRVIVAATPWEPKDFRIRLADAIFTGLASTGASDLSLASEGLAAGRAYTLFDAKRVMVSDDEIARAKEQKLISDEDVELQGPNKSIRYVYLRSPRVAHEATSVANRGMYRLPLRKFAILCDRVYVGPRVDSAIAAQQASAR